MNIKTELSSDFSGAETIDFAFRVTHGLPFTVPVPIIIGSVDLDLLSTPVSPDEYPEGVNIDFWYGHNSNCGPVPAELGHLQNTIRELYELEHARSRTGQVHVRFGQFPLSVFMRDPNQVAAAVPHFDLKQTYPGPFTVYPCMFTVSDRQETTTFQAGHSEGIPTPTPGVTRDFKLYDAHLKSLLPTNFVVTHELQPSAGEIVASNGPHMGPEDVAGSPSDLRTILRVCTVQASFATWY